ncbi:2-succinyl-5-enolpyruvyl-6-hydroxy-3-cyclohexene-1-carboxylic-acid synthase [Oscillatoria sp. CS-180]|uniref:2-succinyl-5-enolpyruvyl-6-hydroxy-3- cyclohexene-1-carboxylic-acid synthase n=1 Tax=Oscillatoria sp. CS-180 TaxID=3021720 RepID=UPI00232FDC56|nr:2-succinyl-5-enolpyruvyl-6-hydroxy-3-cyclohexene-1-carboxylic-acid synthase [Oscillatoria sp. CS-180]MDB9525567.1 2-succinyl-5-enolpyruvyl-6-hydroxy-3-cyclohexene-1-carboxylic-acid synthase [Oscillatoria sp. CS-180]
MLDFRNTNTVWASVFVETLARLGVTTVVISPGSRSTPLTFAFIDHPKFTAIPILDERSAGFFALGVAKASGQVTVLVCTSGSAGANYFPAVIEAYESEVPLLVLTADRPYELRDCASGQTIDQQRLFGRYVRGYADIALPESSLDQLRYLRQTVLQAWHQCQFPGLGPVHLNCPFRDPLAPIPSALADPLIQQMDDHFFEHLDLMAVRGAPTFATESVPSKLGQTSRGLIIAGPVQPQKPKRYCEAIATLSQLLGWPVLADGLSPLRNYARLNPSLITTYDLLLRHPHQTGALVPEQVIQLGALPTSKVLRQWLKQIDPLRWIVDTSGRNKDPVHGTTIFLGISLEALIAHIPPRERNDSSYCQMWVERDDNARQQLTQSLEPLEYLFEGKLSWLLPTLLPANTPLMIANSTPVRDVEWFWSVNDKGIQPYFSRGANGIEGTLSTALGIAHHHQKAVLLTGDLALLHDSNGFLNVAQRSGHLTILLINNRGGGIFESLPIAQFDPPFETFFATPQHIDFSLLAAAHGVTHETIDSWASLKTALAELPSSGVRLLELKCDRKADTQFRSALLQSAGA